MSRVRIYLLDSLVRAAGVDSDSGKAPRASTTIVGDGAPTPALRFPGTSPLRRGGINRATALRGVGALYYAVAPHDARGRDRFPGTGEERALIAGNVGGGSVSIDALSMGETGAGQSRGAFPAALPRCHSPLQILSKSGRITRIARCSRAGLGGCALIGSVTCCANNPGAGVADLATLETRQGKVAGVGSDNSKIAILDRMAALLVRCHPRCTRDEIDDRGYPRGGLPGA
jgi:hypothetical protein